MNIVITGNIGCGKSTFTKMLAARLPNHTVFDVDAAIHGLYDTNRFRELLQDRFGTYDRAAVSDIVFKDMRQLRWLESVSRSALLPYMVEAIRAENTIFDFPLYYEEGMLEPYGAGTSPLVVAVHCSPETQRERIAERGRFTTEKADAIIAQQLSHSVKASLSDYQVSTDGTLAEMELCAAEIAQKVKIAQLEQRFLELINEPIVWEALKEQYTQPWRHYHDINHLVKMFDQFDKVEHLIHNKVAVQLAIFYHDYVYDAYEGYENNEALSAKALWRDVLNYAPSLAARPQLFAQCAAEMILATKGHRITSPYVLSKSGLLSDCQHFLDIDLSGLGLATIEEALVDDDRIRKEFAMYLDRPFAEGRIKAMSSFVERPELFQSEVFKPLETQAKINLAHIIARYKTMLEK